ncbi:zinc-dependent alcohol dehydrogenase family protein [bacterium]|nr:zinc-dependent alcohol dehydrogenase family protein [bacterium]MCB2179236.1 zinc-dependent alcohol dehydrogenase family protein [bacterium]
MLAQRFSTPKPADQSPLTLETLPLPEPGPGQVRIKLTYCGVCHTDLHIVEGDIHPPHTPVTPGHQAVGRIDALGQGVTERYIGQRVGVPWLYAACGKCEYCQRGMENLCENARFTGFHHDGGFAEAMLAEAAYTLPLPESISDQHAAPLLCAGIIGYRSLRKADLQPGERLGLFGFGASAHLTIQVARDWGCEVYAFTRSEEHRQHALELGAAWAGGSEDTPPKLLDRAITFAPVGKIVPQALAKLRPGGTLAINAVHLSPIPEMPYELIYGERTLRSVANATFQDGVEFLELAAQIPIQPTTTRYPLAEANQALLDLKESKLNGEAVLAISPDD